MIFYRSWRTFIPYKTHTEGVNTMEKVFSKKNVSEDIRNVSLYKENTDCSCTEAKNICPVTTNKPCDD